jgi:hypothetical protein
MASSSPFFVQRTRHMFSCWIVFSFKCGDKTFARKTSIFVKISIQKMCLLVTTYDFVCEEQRYPKKVLCHEIVADFFRRV